MNTGTKTQDSNHNNKDASDHSRLSSWIKCYGFWIACYVAVLSYPVFSDSSIKYWHTAALLFLIVFVNIFTDPIPLPTPEGMEPDDKNQYEANTRIKEKCQRRNWMIVAYGFMLFSMVVSIYPFTKSWNSDNKSSTDNYVETLRERPIAVFVGCSLDSSRAVTEIGCKPQPKPSGDNAKNGEKNGNKNETSPPTATPATLGKSWLLSIGGYVTACNKANGNNGSPLVCNIEGGLLTPLYVIILSLMGGSISLTRRLPEYQKQASPGYVATEKQQKLTQHEFREYLIFQIVQFISAPFIAVVAYSLIEPKDVTASVVLAFMAGFASESILLMIRSVADKVTPKTVSTPAFGAITGTVSFIDKSAGTPAKPIPISNAEVLLTETPQIRTLTDESGCFVLGNVPIGEHAIKVTYVEKDKPKPGETTKDEKTDSVKIEKNQVIVKKHITFEKK